MSISVNANGITLGDGVGFDLKFMGYGTSQISWTTSNSNWSYTKTLPSLSVGSCGFYSHNFRVPGSSNPSGTYRWNIRLPSSGTYHYKLSKAIFASGPTGEVASGGTTIFSDDVRQGSSDTSATIYVAIYRIS